MYNNRWEYIHPMDLNGCSSFTHKYAAFSCQTPLDWRFQPLGRGSGHFILYLIYFAWFACLASVRNGYLQNGLANTDFKLIFMCAVQWYKGCKFDQASSD